MISVQGRSVAMRIGLMRWGKACGLRAVRRMRVARHDRAVRDGAASPPVRATLMGWGVCVSIGEPSPRERLVSRMESMGEESHAVESIENIGWIGEDLLLLRLGMIDLGGGGSFTRWVVFDCSRPEVDYLTHDLRLPEGSVVSVVPSTDEDHVWLQCVRLISEPGGLRQVESEDGAVLELHRVPLDRLLSDEEPLAQLFGPLTCRCSPTAAMLTAGERARLGVGELALVEDVQIREDGSLSVLALFGSQETEGTATQVHRLCELCLDPAGTWSSERLFDPMTDEELMVM